MGKYTVILAPKAKKHFREIHKSGSKTTIRKIEKLVLELSEHPYTGTGKVKQLRGVQGIWSRRIDKKNRLLYMVKEEDAVVLILSVIGHYDDI
jgi:toxin YoeB